MEHFTRIAKIRSKLSIITFKKCLKHYLLLVWTHCIWYTGITVVLCDFAVLPFFLCSFMFVCYLFFCVCVFCLLRWPAWYLSFLATCHSVVCVEWIIIILWQCGLMKFFFCDVGYGGNDGLWEKSGSGPVKRRGAPRHQQYRMWERESLKLDKRLYLYTKTHCRLQKDPERWRSLTVIYLLT